MMAIRKLEERLITRLVIGLHWEDNWFALGGHGLCQQDNYFYTACIQSTPHGTTMHKVKKVCVTVLPILSHSSYCPALNSFCHYKSLRNHWCVYKNILQLHTHYPVYLYCFQCIFVFPQTYFISNMFCV